MYKISGLLTYPKLFHAFSEKKDGNMANSILYKLQDFSVVVPNRKKFLASLDIPLEKTICMWVVHKDEVAIANHKLAGKSILDPKYAVKVDALITNSKNLYLFLLIADCAPVILYDPVKQTLALIHVGWKGADLEIVKRVVKRLKDEYDSRPENLIVGIGPAAQKNSFIKESPSQLSDKKWQPFLEKVIGDHPERVKRVEGYKVDFVGLVKRQLQDSGVFEKNIIDCGIDTVTDERFYSHLREVKLPLEKQGRFACIVGLK